MLEKELKREITVSLEMKLTGNGGYIRKYVIYKENALLDVKSESAFLFFK